MLITTKGTPMQPHLPQFITFTGADDHTNPADMRRLAEDHPVEFGILFSPKRIGQPRYPSAAWVSRLLEEFPHPLSAHICGAHSRDLLHTGQVPELMPFLASGRFQRVQINTAEPHLHEHLPALAAWGKSLGVTVILQTRDARTFPAYDQVNWLFDQSGGAGVQPASWPTEPTDRLVGYAGGLNLANVSGAVASIGANASRTWIDLETGARDAEDRFSLPLCRQICEEVYGR